VRLNNYEKYYRRGTANHLKSHLTRLATKIAKEERTSMSAFHSYATSGIKFIFVDKELSTKKYTHYLCTDSTSRMPTTFPS